MVISVLKRRKCFVWLILAFLVVCLAFSIPSPKVKALQNATGGGTYYALTYENYRHAYMMHTTPTMTNYFGSHDWIAESALCILRENRLSLSPASRYFVDLLFPSPGFGTSFLHYFLLGTEAPDAVRNGYSIQLIDCKGRSYECGPRWQSVDRPVKNVPHHVFLDGIIPYNSPAADGAHHSYKIAVQALLEGDCKKAAFFLGAMCHFIGDMASYSHLIDTAIPGNPTSSDINTYKATWEKYIAWLTWRPARFRGAYQEVDFFSITLAKSMFNPSVGDRPWMGTYKAALATNEYTMWFYNQFVNNEDFLFGAFKVYATGSVNRDRILPYTRANFPDPSDGSYTYFKRVEDCLNYAIRYCAEAINLAAANFVDCGCGEESSMLPKLTQTTPETMLQENLVAQVYFVVWGLTSVYSSLYAISLAAAASKLKELSVTVSIKL